MPVDFGPITTFAGSMLVDEKYFSLNSQDWPVRAPTSNGNGYSAPSFTFKSFCTFDCPPLHWRSIETSAGVYNWSTIDSLMSTLSGLNVPEVVMAVYATPTFHAQAGHQSTAGPYGGLGEASPPTSLSALANFCTALETRNVNNYGGRIKAYQAWNEPENAPFWLGTLPQLVDVAWTIRSAVQAVTPSRLTLTHGCYDYNTLGNFFSSQGPSTGKYGHATFDHLSAHPYWSTPNPTYTGRGDFRTLSDGGLLGGRAVLDAWGKTSAEIWITEYGIDSGGSKPSPTPTVAAFLASSTANRRTQASRFLLSALLAGAKRFAPWSYGGPDLMGDLAADTNGVAAGYQDVYTACAGKTIIRGGYFQDGRVWALFSDGIYYVV